MLAAIGILAAYLLSPEGNFRYFILGGVILFLLLAIHSYATKITLTEIDLTSRTVRQYYAVAIPARFREEPINKYEIILANVNYGRSGPLWISVSFSGRNGSLELARFGTEQLHYSGGRWEHHLALELRSSLANALHFRDIGVV